MQLNARSSIVLVATLLGLIALVSPVNAEDFSPCYVCGVEDGYASCIGQSIPNFSAKRCQTTCIWGLTGKVCYCRTFGLQCSASSPGDFLVGDGPKTEAFTINDQVKEALKLEADPVLVDLAGWHVPNEAVQYGRGPQAVNGTFSVGELFYDYSGEATVSSRGLVIRYELDGYPGAQAIEMHVTASQATLTVERSNGELQRVTAAR